MKKRVLIVGGGAAGSNCAWALGQHPDLFEVEVWERGSRPGGVAQSREIREGVNLNYGVQGGAPSYRNTLNLLKRLGLSVSDVKMRISFGKKSEGTYWNNFPDEQSTQLIKELGQEIKQFESLIEKVSNREWLYGIQPISKVLRSNGFSEKFQNLVAFPLTALFFGTGNQTPHVPAALFMRVFNDPHLRLYNFSPERFLSDEADMFAFPPFEDYYGAIYDSVKEGVQLRLRKECVSIERGSNLNLQLFVGIGILLTLGILLCTSQISLAWGFLAFVFSVIIFVFFIEPRSYDGRRIKATD